MRQLREWLKANGGPPAVVIAGLGLIALTPLVGVPIAVIGAVWFLLSLDPVQQRLSWKVVRNHEIRRRLAATQDELTTNQMRIGQAKHQGYFAANFQCVADEWPHVRDLLVHSDFAFLRKVISSAYIATGHLNELVDAKRIPRGVAPMDGINVDPVVEQVAQAREEIREYLDSHAKTPSARRQPS